MRLFRWTSTAMLLVIATAACQDLDVVNTNAPDRERAQADPAALYALNEASYRTIWTALHRSSSAYNVFPLVADEAAGTYANNAALELSSEPRPVFNNNPTADAQGLARFTWEYHYETISNSADAMSAINGGLEIILEEDEDQNFTDEIILWSKFLQGVAHGHLSMLYDRGFVHTEADLNTPVEQMEMVPYPELLQASLAMLDDAISFAQANPDLIIPDGWFGPSGDLTTDQVIQIANHNAAMFMVYGARTPEERENLDWDEVLRRLDAGITESVWMEMDGSFWYLTNQNRLTTEGTFVAYADHKLFGPADISGEYQNWLSLPFRDREPITMVTPDLRFPQGSEWGDRGLLFEYDLSNVFSPERGLYHISYYQFESEYTRYWSRPYKHVPMWEADLMRAEALFFKGDLAGAADLINITRVERGGLPPVTAAGVPGGPGECVPHRSSTTQECGGLYEALMWERMVEGFGHTSTRGYMDSRGFGRMSEGTFLQLPVPGRELGSLGIEVYTFGGVGGPMAAGPFIR